ncbi:FxsA family protein [Pseudohongiella nitratireducens]|uniref:FxsA family protein n=1 Tax=Pseudohongiella nitratireducens TaxID=1768907 RepID=UPI0030EBB865
MRIPFLAFVLIPMAELYLLFTVADWIGGFTTLALVILTAAVGLSVLRVQGFATLVRANQRMAQGQVPGQEIVEGMMLAIAGALLLTPGLITDTVGFALLTPLIRRKLAQQAMKKGSFFFMGGGGQFRAGGGFGAGGPFGQGSGGRGNTIDGEVVDRDNIDPDRGLNGDTADKDEPGSSGRH